jgi:imidazolonepropionase
VGLSDEVGRIAVGYRANLLVLDAPSYVSLPYRLGTNLTHVVVARGRIVVERGRRVGTRGGGRRPSPRRGAPR